MLITLVRCWMFCLLLGDDVDEVRMMAMSPSRMVAAAAALEDPSDEDACSSDDEVALFVGLKFKISSSPDKRVSDSESLGLVF